MTTAMVTSNLRTRLLQGVACHACDRAWAQGGERVHQDPFHRLYAVTAGEGMVVHHERMFHLRPGYLFVIPAHTPGRYRCAESMSLTWLHFTVSVFAGLDPFVTLNWPFVVRARAVDHDRLRRVITLQSADRLASLLEAEGLLRGLLARFAAAADAPDPDRLAPLSRLQPALDYIENHLCERFTLAQLAAAVHLHPTYFSNLFSRHLGLPPMTYANRRRAEHAAVLLAGDDLSLAEVAGAVGFGDVYYFSKTFKRFLGLSPGAYRRQMQLSG